MEAHQIHIKNVVCQRCIMTIETILERLNIPFHEVKLGEATLQRKLKVSEVELLEKEFEKVGFEIVQTRDERMINKIKSIIIEEVYSDEAGSAKLSEILASRLNYDYSHITHIFSEKEGQSIQKFYNAVRIERSKELIDNAELSLAEISDRLGYSTPAYLSTSFKKATGYTPSEYKNLNLQDRKNLDSV